MKNDANAASTATTTPIMKKMPVLVAIAIGASLLPKHTGHASAARGTASVSDEIVRTRTIEPVNRILRAFVPSWRLVARQLITASAFFVETPRRRPPCRYRPPARRRQLPRNLSRDPPATSAHPRRR